MCDGDLALRIAGNLKAIRRAEGISQERLAALSSLHRTEVGLIERGQRLPRADTILKLAGALGTDPNGILGGVQWVPADPSRGAFAFASAPRFMHHEEEGRADG